MIRLLCGLLLLAFVGLDATLARGEDCAVAAGEYFDADPTEKVLPAIALEVDTDTCFIQGRDLAGPGEAFDPYVSTYWAEFTEPLAGPPPYDNPYGCPFGPGDSADWLGDDEQWRPALVEESDRACGYVLRVYSGAVADIVEASGYDYERLRAAELKGPTQAEIAAAKLCPRGGAFADFSDGSEDSMFKRAIIADLSDRAKMPVHVSFEDIRFGQIQIVTDYGPFIRDHPDAPVGGEIYPFRLTASVCREVGDRPQTARSQFDYNCYYDKFGDFACRQEAERGL